MRMKEFKDFTGLTYSEVSKALGLPQSRCEKLYRGVINHNTKDIEAISKYMKNRGKNVIYIDFKPRENTREPFKWEQRREIDLNEYRANKRREQQKIDKINRAIQKSSKPCRGFERLHDN